MYPEFPYFKPVELLDRDVIHGFFRDYLPETSELTFTNLYIWRDHYGFQWTIYDDWLLIIYSVGGNLHALPPVGRPSRSDVVVILLEWLKEEMGSKEPFIDRADGRLLSEVEGVEILLAEPTRDQFDYVYESSALIGLAGKKYSSKRQQINRFKRKYGFEYRPMERDDLMECRELAGRWCDIRRCDEDMNLMDEWSSVNEALENFGELGLSGGMVMVDGRMEAFAMGEKLNERTAVIHIEKANTGIEGLYTLINQQFAENHWHDIEFINREQDLGVPGLRQAKLSYHPVRMVKKYTIRKRYESDQK